MTATHPIGRARLRGPGARTPPAVGSGTGRTRAATLAPGLYALGAVCLAVEAVVHIQQFVVIFRDVTWIGPLFIANAAA